MNKLFPLIVIPLFMLACGDDKSSSASDDELSSSSEEASIESSSNEEIDSSSSETKNEPASSSSALEANSSKDKAESSSSEVKEKSSSSKGIISEDGWVTTVKIDNFSFFDEKYLRYYFLEEECDYDSTTNTFKWVTEDYTGVFNRYDRSILEDKFNGDSLKYMIWHSFGFKISNDTLYECDYIGDACETIETATVYVGTSKSIFSTWECVGRIYKGEYSEIPSNYKITLTLAPQQRTITTRSKIKGSKYTPEPRQYCGVIYDLFNDEQREELCNNKLQNIQALSTDTVFISNDMWILAKDLDKADLSVNDQIFEVSFNHILEMDPTQISTFTKKITYQGSTCTWWQKNVEITQEYCENGDHSQDNVESEFSNIHRTFIKQLQGSSDNDNEFEECTKQFNLK